MNPPKVSDTDYINFLLAAPSKFTCTEAARTRPDGTGAPSHDSFNRLLLRTPQDTGALWSEAEPIVKKSAGALVLDDTTLDKPYSQKIALVTNHWGGKHHRVVRGINVITLLWTDGERVPTDFRSPEQVPLDEKGPLGYLLEFEWRELLFLAQFRPSLITTRAKSVFGCGFSREGAGAEWVSPPFCRRTFYEPQPRKMCLRGLSSTSDIPIHR